MEAAYAIARTLEEKHELTMQMVDMQNKWRAAARPEDRRYIQWRNERGNLCEMEIMPG